MQRFNNSYRTRSIVILITWLERDMTGLGVVTACAMGVVGITIGTTLLDLTDNKREAAMKQFLKIQCFTEISQIELAGQNRYKTQTILRTSPHVKAACAGLS
jgi:hypothetical protein